MIALSMVMHIVPIFWLATSGDSPPEDAEPWATIRSFGDPAGGSPEREAYLESLTPEEMLRGARQACERIEAHVSAGRHFDAPPEAGASLSVALCLTYYIDKAGLDTGGKTLMKVVAEPGESPYLRSAIIARIDIPVTRFHYMFQKYVDTHRSEIDTVFEGILGNECNDPLVQEGVVRALGGSLRRQVDNIAESDPSVLAIRKQTGRPVIVGKLVRSGEVTLSDDTLKALEPLQARSVAYIKLISAIVAKGENQREGFESEVRRRLELYRESPLTGIDQEVEKALKRIGD